MPSSRLKQRWASYSQDHFSILTDADRYHIWEACVSRYTECSLTRASDKLIALSGIAIDLNEIWGSRGTYLAGLWKGGLARQLLWVVPNMYKGGTRPKSYWAPTWSWASIDGAISPCLKEYRMCGSSHLPVTWVPILGACVFLWVAYIWAPPLGLSLAETLNSVVSLSKQS